MAWMRANNWRRSPARRRINELEMQEARLLRLLQTGTTLTEKRKFAAAAMGKELNLNSTI